MRLKLNILFEDEAIIVVEKPSGLLSIPDRHNDKLPSVLGILRKKFDHVYTIHRIDKETSGVMIFGKTAESHKMLSLDFQNRVISKTYLAFVKGTFHHTEGEITIPIRKSATSSLMKPHEKGKPSHTKYVVLANYQHYALVKLELLTGRTHQIRVHMSYINHPLIVDSLYHKSAEGFYLSELKGKKYKLASDVEERPLINRLTLHAYSIEFKHPTTKKTMYFEASLPKDLRALKKQLEKKW